MLRLLSLLANWMLLEKIRGRNLKAKQHWKRQMEMRRHKILLMRNRSFTGVGTLAYGTKKGKVWKKKKTREKDLSHWASKNMINYLIPSIHMMRLDYFRIFGRFLCLLSWGCFGFESSYMELGMKFTSLYSYLITSFPFSFRNFELIYLYLNICFMVRLVAVNGYILHNYTCLKFFLASSI